MILLENVDRLLKSPVSQRGRDFGIILACLNDLRYTVEWRVVNAAEYGFPQRRRRAFIVGRRDGPATSSRVNAMDWIAKEGDLAQALPVKWNDFGLTGEKFDIKGDIHFISDHFGQGLGCSPFGLTGVCEDRQVTTCPVPADSARDSQYSSRRVTSRQ